MPTRQEWLLRFIAGPEQYGEWVDRIRLMKGLFLFQKTGIAPAEVNYKFSPYDYGPFTPEVYRDTELLESEGWVLPSRDGQSYRATDAGKQWLATVHFPPKPGATLDDLRVEVSELSFRELLKRVYSAYPESAARSVAKDVLR